MSPTFSSDPLARRSQRSGMITTEALPAPADNVKVAQEYPGCHFWTPSWMTKGKGLTL
ncbi:hypothetical protein [Alcanivorax sp.]|uniref:hypothetical protein n=1 Tax=Alcanivorax sp. TaxID=1872427 RepID=UPI0025B94630|nr:hypothetical protein [Alcanivorax sp.]